MKNPYLKAAEHYYDLGFNITCISNVKNEYNSRGENYWMKAPNHEWEDLWTRRQTREEYFSYDWSNATGVGVATGYNNHLVIDLDDCSAEFMSLTLSALDLNPDYPWVIRSGSGNGYHIHVRVGNLCEIYPNLPAIRLFPYFNCSEHVKKVELLIRLHAILPPSLHTSGNKYLFLNTRKMPTTPPSTIRFHLLNNYVNSNFEDNREYSKTSSGISLEKIFVCPNEPHTWKDVLLGCDLCKAENERRAVIAQKIQAKRAKDKEIFAQQKGREEWYSYQSLRTEIAEMPKYIAWRQKVFALNGKRCEIDGSKSNLEVHHRKSMYKILHENDIETKFEAFECDELWDPDNGSVLCKKCHDNMDSSITFRGLSGHDAA